MIYTDEFRLNENRQEILTSLSDDFPYTCLDVTLDRLIGRSWHWHTALELDYVASGNMYLQTPEHTFLLKPGDAIFINTQVIHDARSDEDSKTRRRIIAACMPRCLIPSFCPECTEAAWSENTCAPSWTVRRWMPGYSAQAIRRIFRQSLPS